MDWGKELLLRFIGFRKYRIFCNGAYEKTVFARDERGAIDRFLDDLNEEGDRRLLSSIFDAKAVRSNLFE
jgi:hypothetical protein